jgi:hypothetical protein
VQRAVCTCTTVIKVGSDLQILKSVPPGVQAGRGLASGVARLGVLGRPFGLRWLPGVLGTVSCCGGELLVLAAVLPRVVGVAGRAMGVFCGTGCVGEGLFMGDDMVMQSRAGFSPGSWGLTALRMED